MTPDAVNDVHAPYVQALFDNGDWTGLVRYWLAHHYEAALAQAVALVAARADVEEGRWRTLVNFLTDVQRKPITFDREPPDFDWEEWTPVERVTVRLTHLSPWVALCSLAKQARLEDQEQRFRMGIESGTVTQEVAERLGDDALRASSLFSQACGWSELGQLEAARDSYQEALAIRRELARQRPDVYRPAVAGTLNNLGNVQRDLNDLETARASFQEALTGYRELARQHPDLWWPEVAGTLNNLGLVLRWRRPGTVTRRR
jgi:tetratricopeptide (TPR) repeat protein